jgi:hypothetical protein
VGTNSFPRDRTEQKEALWQGKDWGKALASRMRGYVLLGVSLLATSFSPGQIPKPPKELSKFDVLLGNWEGSGTRRARPDGEEFDWTAFMTTSKIMDGHFIQEDLSIYLGTENPVRFVTRAIYGWDPDAKQFKVFRVGNGGFRGPRKVYWTADGKLVNVGTRLQRGLLITEQSVTESLGDKYRIRVEGSVNGGRFFELGEGVFVRRKESFSASEEVGASASVPNEMKELEGRVGQWKMKGQLSPTPGAPLVPISGREEVRFMLAGHVQLFRAEGDPSADGPKAYRGELYLTWDAERNCYFGFGVNNFGSSEYQEAYSLGGNRMVFTGTTVHAQIPHSGRSIMEWSKDSKKYTIVSHRLAGDSPPDKSFEAEFERIEEP